MKLSISTAMLIHITKNISKGRVLYGLLLANEYMDKTEMLRSALVVKAKSKLSPLYQEIDDILELIFAGLTMRELSEEMQSRIRNFRESSKVQDNAIIGTFRFKKTTAQKRAVQSRRAI